MSRGRGAAVLVAAAGIAAVYFSTQAYLNPFLRGRVTFANALMVNLTYYSLWALAVPLILRIARKLPFERQGWWKAFAIHLVASVAITAAVILVSEVILVALGERSPAPWRTRLAFGFAANFHSLLPTYWMVLLAYLAFDFYVKLRDREVRAAQLEARLSEARLSALKAQLQPHFLFNTMNSISSLMYEDVEAADAMLTRLSELLRLTIDRDRQLVPLQEEVDLVQRYLDIERVRFEDRLRVEYDVPADLESALVPSLILQPLVENAVRHSIAPREGGGRIRIAAARQDHCLELRVDDDGPGMRASDVPQKGVGLSNTEARLLQLYGSASALQFTAGPHGWFGVRVLIPLTGHAA